MRAAKSLTSPLIGAFVAGAIATGAFALSCEGAIAPLPSPIVDPDDDRIITSSLGLASDSGVDYLVAVVGFDGAVSDDGLVEVLNPRTGLSETVAASQKGSFSTGVYGQAADVLEVRSVSADGKSRSQPVRLTISEYFAPDLAAEAVATSDDFPAAPGEGQFAGAADPDGDNGGEEPPDTKNNERLDVIWSFENGILTVDAASGFTTPNAIVILSNADTGAVAAKPADTGGGIRLAISASVGDQMLMFTQSSANPGLTSPAIRFLVPEAGASGGRSDPLPTPP